MEARTLPGIASGFLLWLYDEEQVGNSQESGRMTLLIDEWHEDKEGQAASWMADCKEEDALPQGRVQGATSTQEYQPRNYGLDKGMQYCGQAEPAGHPWKRWMSQWDVQPVYYLWGSGGKRHFQPAQTELNA